MKDMSRISEQPYFQDVARVVALLASNHPELLKQHGAADDSLAKMKEDPLPFVEEAFKSFPEDLYFDLFHLDPIGAALDVLNIEDSPLVSEKILPTYQEYRSTNKLRLVTYNDLVREQLEAALQRETRSKPDESTSGPADPSGQSEPLDQSVESGSSEPESLIEVAIEMLSQKKQELGNLLDEVGHTVTEYPSFLMSTKLSAYIDIFLENTWIDPQTDRRKFIQILVHDGDTVDIVKFEVSLYEHDQGDEMYASRKLLLDVTADSVESLRDAFATMEALPEIVSLRKRAPVIRRLRSNAATKSTAD
ncbi:MAG: hypothetical protein EAZ99_14885 [Alphaproteobacteria bacterium]|nr:MAG: hypothetical protein EAZ99_14885 [Alphaproteobacteria bacterium]